MKTVSRLAPWLEVVGTWRRVIGSRGGVVMCCAPEPGRVDVCAPEPGRVDVCVNECRLDTRMRLCTSASIHVDVVPVECFYL